MMSISAMSGGQGEYYLNLAQEDYYLAGGEPPGLWFGQGAEKLGLAQDSQVEKNQFRYVFAGFDPTGAEPLVQNAGKENRQPGWDLTFSAPKSVSVIWSQADLETRLEIQASQAEAAQKALGYLQENAAWTRTGKGGVELERAALVVAMFEHGTSRAQDPQLHTHALVLNVGVREDGQTGTIKSHALFRHAKAAGAVYRAELAHQLEKRLNLIPEAREEGWGFEVKGVPKALMEEFSKRREAIEAKLKELGYESAKAAEAAALDTRQVKAHRARAELLEDWRAVGKEFEFTWREVSRMIESERRFAPKHLLESLAGDAATQTAKELTQQQSYFFERQFVASFYDKVTCHGLGAEAAKDISKKFLQSREVILLGREGREERLYTTPEMMALEKELIKSLAKANEGGRSVGPETVERAIRRMEKEKGFSLEEEQKNAVRHLAESRAQIVCVSGMAGTGKTTMLEAARKAWEAGGLRVKGVSLAGKAALNMQNESGIQSTTIAKLLYDLDKHDRTLESERPAPDPLRGVKVLTVDEAGMVDTRTLSRLIQETKMRGVKLALVGDAKQLQAIGAGGGFLAATTTLGHVELKNIRRQKEEWARKAVHDFAEGRAREALKEYSKRGLLTVAKNVEEARAAMIEQWRKDGGLAKPQHALLIASTNDDVRKLNWAAQETLRKERKLGGLSLKQNGYEIHKGDRVLFCRRERKLGLENGDFGTVEKLNPLTKQVQVRLDRKKTLWVSLKDYQDLKLGYASTTHKSQGSTIDRVYTLAGGSMQDREISYVQMSRGREMTLVFTDEETAGDELAELSKTMSRSRQKVLATWKARELDSDPEGRATQETRTPRTVFSSAKRELELEGKEVAAQVMKDLTQKRRDFSEREFVATFLEQMARREWKAETAQEMAAKYLASREAILVEDGPEGRRYTTQERRALEKEMLRELSVRSSGAKAAPKEAVEQAITRLEEEKGVRFNDSERQAVKRMAEGREQVLCVSGVADMDKTTALEAARKAWEAAGWSVKSVTAKDTALRGETVSRLLEDLDRRESSDPLRGVKVLLVKDAEQIDARPMRRLLEETKKRGVKLVLSGDIEPEGGFAAVANKIGHVELKEILPSKEPEALRDYFRQGLLTVTKTMEAARAEMIGQWREEGGVARPRRALLVASTNDEVRKLNGAAQEARRRAGRLGGASLKQNGYVFHEGDRVLFGRGERKLGVAHGDLGTLEKIDTLTKQALVRLDQGKTLRVSLKDYEDLRLGYALPARESRGARVDRVYALVDGATTRDMRGRAVARVFADEKTAGAELTGLAKALDRVRQIELASKTRERSLELSL